MTDTLPVDPVAKARSAAILAVYHFADVAQREPNSHSRSADYARADQAAMDAIGRLAAAQAQKPAVRPEHVKALGEAVNFLHRIYGSVCMERSMLRGLEELARILSALEEAPPQPEQPAPASGDLVERARKMANQFSMLLSDPPKPRPEAVMLRDLADALEARDREIAELKSERDELEERASGYWQTIEKDVFLGSSTEKELRTQLAALKAEVDAMAATLRMPDADRRQWVLADMIARQGYFNWADLCSQFGISVPQASVDIRRFLANHPHIAVYNKSTKRYERAALSGKGEG